jgi:hypothetical protein
MSDWFDRIAKLAILGEKFALLADNIGKLQSKVEDHEKRLVRVETIIEIARPDGSTMRILPGGASAPQY